jgi:type I restriction enzyme, S subunit
MTEALPPNWEKWRLADVGDWAGGGTPSSTNEAYWNGDIPWVSPKDMKVSEIHYTQDQITRPAIDNSAARMIPENSVLFVTRSGILAHSFPVAINRVPVTVNQDLKAITPARGVDAKYLAWVLRAFARTILTICSKHGTTVHSIETSALKAFSIPVPPFKEQRRIVAKIEQLFSELDKGVEALETARQQLTVYRQAVVKHAFEGRLTEEWRAMNASPAPDRLLVRIQAERDKRYEDAKAKGDGRLSRYRKPARVQPEKRNESFPSVPAGWATEYLGNLNVEIFDGPFGSQLKTSDYVESGVRVIRLENIGHGRFIDEKRSFVSKMKYEAIKKHTVVPGDIVFSSFVTESIRSALVPQSIPFAVNKADCFCVRFFGEALRAKFVQYFLESRNAFKQVQGMIHGVGRPRINTSQLKEVVVPICSPEEQGVLIEKLERAFSEIDTLESNLDARLTELAVLRQCILRRAFAGALVSQDPKDEPVEVLLERIKSKRETVSNGSQSGRRRVAA